MVKARLTELGYAETAYDAQSIYEKFKALADKKGTVYDDDLVTLMESEAGHEVADMFTLDYLNVSCGRGVSPMAMARLTVDGKTVQAAAYGDGPVHAATNAIDQIVGYKIEVDNFYIAAITEGREAQANVKISASSAEGSFVGRGVSTDIVEASALAYMDIVNKIARMKKFKRKVPKIVSD
jgi:2-isopropylmalate synthase